ncbi:DNA polymerase III subunit alpha [Candidatus Peregrinibacteria bacterium]|nr:DNA polymerase III subunit alpha [Candidatus Peregrinibacteria bacterium]
MSFVHLHNHTHYSLLDGLSRPKDCIKHAKKQGSPAIAITDHGVMYGAIEFYKAGKEEGINPIIGCEIYVAPDGRFKKEPGTSINHLTLLAETTEGYHNLMQLVTKAHLEGFYYKPRVDHGLLKAYGKGLIALSGCLNSETSKAILNGQEERAIEIIKKYQDIFGSENYFLEVQDHVEMANQILVNQAIYGIANRTGINLVATNDNHYLCGDDHDAHDILICIQTGKTVADPDRMHYTGNFSVRSPEEMAQAFKDHPQAIFNTLEIAKRCKVEINFGKNLIPHFNTPQNKDPQEYLRELCEEGVKERYSEITEAIKRRLDYELTTIHNSGFDTYFLIVHDFVKYAKEHGVIVGPGRGSAAGSLVSYSLQITDVDPLEYGLLFERFLNPSRVSMPDIDIDFDDAHRNEVLAYVVNKYGRDNVAQIITFGTMASRSVVRDVGRAMGYPYDEVDKLAKLVPQPIQGRHVPLAMSIHEDPELKRAYETDKRAKALLDKALKLEGTVRHAGTHACAVVISQKPLSEYSPLQKTTGEEGVITQYSMKPLEELGLLKMDFLGLKNLTIIKDALETIERVHGDKIDLTHLPLDDKKTFELLAKGNTTGVFQLESAGMRRYLKELKPTAINDIIAMVSLYRPGPMPWIPVYIKGKHDPKSVTYIDPSFEKILKETYGVAVYQEQILEIARDFAGFSLGEADILRKAVGKKDPKLLAGEREKFVSGAVKKNHSKKFAENVFEKVIEPFAAYGFNKSHATCYAFIAYRTAYLKAHYPAAFMAALLTADSSNEEKIALEVDEAESMGISVLPPSINESLANFTVVDTAKIRFGLKAIKGIGDLPIEEIIKAREKGGKFANLEDCFKRIPCSVLNKKLIEALAYSGALDDLGERKAIAASVEEIVRFAKSIQATAVDGQTDIFGMMDPGEHTAVSFKLKAVSPSTKLEELQWEKEYLGLFVSGHPLLGMKKYLAKKAHPIDKIDDKLKGKTVQILGIISKAKRVLTKGGAYMAYVTLEDLTGRMETVVFPRTFQQFGAVIKEGAIVMMEGRAESRRDAMQFIAQLVKDVSLDSMTASAKEAGLFDENEKYVRAILNTKEEKPEADPNEPYTIKLTEKMDAAGMEYLKALLKANHGDRAILIDITTTKGKKQIKVPFGVDLNPELRQQIAEVAK